MNKAKEKIITATVAIQENSEQSNTNYTLAYIFSTIFLLIVCITMVEHRAFLTPDQFFAVAVIVTLFLGKFKQFIRDWSLPVVLLLSYEYLRGLAPMLTQRAHSQPMINFDLMMFGALPTITLQHIFFADGKIHWYDYVAVILYLSHFVVPMLVGFIFWLVKKEIFKEYYIALLLLSYMGFLTYLIFPAMPPWMASKNGYIPHLRHITGTILQNFAYPIHLPTVYQLFKANLVAAVPSLHAAYPFLTFLFFIKAFKHWGFLSFIYVLAVWLTVVYVGDHYVFDVILGALYAGFAFYTATNYKYIVKGLSTLFSYKRKTAKALAYSKVEEEI